MGKTFVVFKREYLERVRSKWFIIATIFGPVLLGLIMVLPVVLAARTKSNVQLANIIILDATSSSLGSRVLFVRRVPKALSDGVVEVRRDE